MTEHELMHLYFEWMLKLVCDERFSSTPRSSYRKLLKFLSEERYCFEEQQPNDHNRALDGIELRYQFGWEEGHPYAMIASLLDYKDCSMLELLISAAFRCEDIVEDRAEGNRVGLWFWSMLQSLGLAKMNDHWIEQHGYEEARDILKRFYRNDYLPNGKGGLFTIEHSPVDMRNQEIYWQMCHYLNAYYT